MWPNLFFPKGEVKYDKLDYRIINVAALVEELQQGRFSGYMEILALHEHGLIIFHSGRIHNCFYEGTDDLKLSPQGILGHFLHNENKERDSVINVLELSPRLVEALSALEPRVPLQRELETSFLDLEKLLETLARKQFTGALRFYQVRNNTRLGNILLKMKKITSDQLKEAIRFQMSNEESLRLGDALVKIGAILPADLDEALKRQTHTRRGSDLEYAIAIFSAGELLGGYTLAGKKLISNRNDILSWANTSEMLMDIVEGHLPGVIEVPAPPIAEELRRAMEAQAPAVEPTPVSLAEAAQRALNAETFQLKADDLIIEMVPFETQSQFNPTPERFFGSSPEIPGAPSAPVDLPAAASEDNLTSSVPQIQPEAPRVLPAAKSIQSKPSVPPVSKPPKMAEAPVEPRPVTPPGEAVLAQETFAMNSEVPPLDRVPKDPLVNHFEELPTAAVSQADPIAAYESGEGAASVLAPEGLAEGGVVENPEPEFPLELHGMDFIDAVLRKYMGFLGIALLRQEQAKYEGAGRGLVNTQLADFCERLAVRIAGLIGPSRSRRLIHIIKENIGE